VLPWPASDARDNIDWMHRILKEERGTVIKSPALEATELHVDNIRWVYVFYESGLSINVLYTLGGLASAPSRSSSVTA
jgi:hypothetical protein